MKSADLQKRKKGDVRQDGKIFYQYVGKKNNLGQRYEWWVTPEQYLKHKELQKVSVQKSRLHSRNKALEKGTLYSPNIFKRGDIKKDGSGYLFWNYGGFDKEGNRRERWLSPKAFEVKFRESKEKLFRYWQNNKERHRQRQNKSRRKHREKTLQKQRILRIEKAHIYNARSRAFRKTPEGRKAKKRWANTYFLRNPHAKIVQSLRGRLGRILRNKKDFHTGPIKDFIGCSKDKLIAHVEGQFEEGMTWDNYGDRRNGKYWVIDHIVPISHFKDIWSSNDQHLIQEHSLLVNHFTNLRPLWWQENLAKGSEKPQWVLVLGKKLWSDLHERAYKIDPDEGMSSDTEDANRQD